MRTSVNGVGALELFYEQIVAFREFDQLHLDLPLESVEGTEYQLQIDRCFESLGVSPADEDKYHKVREIRFALSDRTVHPKPLFETPDVDFFRARIRAILDSKQVPSYQKPIPTPNKLNAMGVALFAETDWEKVPPRGGVDTIEEEIHRLARLMADPIAYVMRFTGIGVFENSHPDPISISKEWHIDNGRHRSLALKCLGAEFVESAGMDHWVTVETRED